MNRAFFTLLLFSNIYLLNIFPGVLYGQDNDSRNTLSQQDLEDYLRQSEQLVRFMEFTFNTLGNPEISAREKDIIINQSYLKFFASGKVQVEDDLVEGRFTVTNKDVQAYLKDIDFFFNNVTFTFNIEDISYNVNQAGQIFFIVTANRNLSGLSVEEDTIYNNQVRFIEINLDRDKRDLKIASIYTSKLSEKEDMRNWWVNLGADWRLFFAKGTTINDEFPLKDILNFDDNWILIERFQVTVIEGYVLESRRPDTIFTNPGKIYQEIGRLWKTETIDITAYPYINDLAPLAKLTELRTINIAGTYVDDLTDIRNLTRLESLNISNSLVEILDPLRHAISLKNLDASHTVIRDLYPLLSFPAIERLNLSNTQVLDLEPLSGLKSLRDLRIINTRISDLNPLQHAKSLLVLDISGTPVNQLDALSNLQSLERLHADNTKITDLKPLSDLANLQYLFIEGTNVSNIQVLADLPSLKRLYCDRTPISREKANRFMQENLNTLVIYESQALTAWWTGLPQVWQDVFRMSINLSEPATREELHEVANITQVNISGNKEILSLSPLQQLLGLRSLLAAETSILSIDPLKENIDLVELDISSTNVNNINVLSSLRIIEKVKLSYTPVEDISPLRTNFQLKYLDLDHTNVSSLKPLKAITNLELVLCDGLGLTLEEVTPVYDSNPNVTVVFQTDTLSKWWQSISDVWINIFQKHTIIDAPPTRFQLHRLTDLRELDISNTRGIHGLEELTKFHRLQILKMNDVQIHDISPLKSLSHLRELYCSNNPISNLEAIKYLERLIVLDCSNTLVRNLNDLRKHSNLEILNISGTQVRNLRPLNNLISLRQLDCYNTRVFSLRPLEALKNLEILRCYNTRVWQVSVNRFMRAVPDCEVVYY